MDRGRAALAVRDRGEQYCLKALSGIFDRGEAVEFGVAVRVLPALKRRLDQLVAA
jgi:hypothetical protein